MNRLTKKLALNKEVVRSLAKGDLVVVQGGLINPSISFCEGGRVCPATQGRACSAEGCW